ncbi:protein PHYTOCHROME KINASE SUBSTRATE 4-like [Curcuma longa]|uniref:protein PHYTOCHROME KINASE SUBSTRATE 4-like n=1 Tax=Curcuma longa TaxID=136217 RepID=UPI003D9DD102
MRCQSNFSALLKPLTGLVSSVSFSTVSPLGINFGRVVMERYYGVTSSFTRGPTTMQSTAPPKPHLGAEATLVSSRSAASAGRSGRCFDDTEISIFDAERYFNEGHEPVKATIFLNGPAERCDLYPRDDGQAKLGRTTSIHSAPTTASSEASWNSHSGLLANSARKYPSKSPSSSGRRLFRRNCPCLGKKAVDVDEKCSELISPLHSGLELKSSSVIAKTPIFRETEVGLSSIPQRAKTEEIKREFGVEEMRKVKIPPRICSPNPSVFSASTRLSPARTFPPEVDRLTVSSAIPFGNPAGFSFPVLNPSSVNSAQEPPRESLEIFRPTKETADSANAPSDFQHRSVVFPFSDEVGRNSFTFPVIPKLPVDDDAASDASSDLFEIESFSTQSMYRWRDSHEHVRRGVDHEATPSIAPSECYAPSEVSVQWSVTTAEGFDRASLANFSSAASHCDDLRIVEVERQRFAGGGGRRRCSGLLSCRSEKAVSVGPKPVRSDSVRPTTNRAIWTR